MAKWTTIVLIAAREQYLFALVWYQVPLHVTCKQLHAMVEIELYYMILEHSYIPYNIRMYKVFPKTNIFCVPKCHPGSIK